MKAQKWMGFCAAWSHGWCPCLWQGAGMRSALGPHPTQSHSGALW